MPVLDHSVFIAPDNHSTRLWRYMDFTKFVSVLHSRALYFPSLERLSREDPFEGALAKRNVEFPDADPERVPLSEIQSLGYKDHSEYAKMLDTFRKNRPHLSRLYRRQRSVIYVNCWHINEHESAAMWSIYAGNAPGIAIVSTYDRLRASLACTDREISIGKVKYIDYSKVAIPFDNLLYPAVHKRQSFAHENELRAVIVDLKSLTVEGEDGVSRWNLDAEIGLPGIYVRCDVEKLVKDIYVSPKSPDWYHEMVQSIIGKFELSFSVHRSDMMTEPFF